MTMFDQPWFSEIRRPSRYLGNEINAVKKNPATTQVSVALAFPDLYEVGMSHLGLKILYRILNAQEWLAAERVFCPWVDMEKALSTHRLPLRSLESGRALSEFDIVGFSLQHELCYTNVLTMLHLGGIPFLSGDRDASCPLVIAGGPACFNPEPVAEIFDAVVIGDGEETALEICRKVRRAKWRRAQVNKEEFLSDLARTRGVYVPSLYRPDYAPDGTILAVRPSPGAPERVDKALIPDIDQYPFPADQVVPFTELVHDRLAIEISRGCTRGCRFCQAGMIYRPVRERRPEAVLKALETALRLTGFEEISLLSLSSGDYGCISPLLRTLMDRRSEEKIAVSLPSLRVDSLDPAWLEQIKRVRKTGFTLAPEAGNDRLRRSLNKALTNEDILNLTPRVYGAGWNLIKLYFMVGLPAETDGDLRDIAHLSREVVSLAKGGGRKPKLNVALSTFVPKSHTPFTWVPQMTLEESVRRIETVQEALHKDRRIRVKWNSPEMSWLEGFFARGDRRLTAALLEAWRMGARFDAWSEHLRMEIWREALDGSGAGPDFYLHRMRSVHETLPWEHIGSGVRKEYLRREWKRAQEGSLTPDCREGCLECGVCDHERVDPILFSQCELPPKGSGSPSGPEGPARRIRLDFTKTGPARHLSHLELARLFVRALKRAGVEFIYSKGYHPMPKISFAAALPVGTASCHETADIRLRGPILLSDLKRSMNEQLPDGIQVQSLVDVTDETGKPALRESHFLIRMNGLAIKRDLLDRFLETRRFPVKRVTQKGEKVIDARPLVKCIRFDPSGALELVILHVPGPDLKPMDLVREIFRLDQADALHINILKVKHVMG